MARMLTVAVTTLTALAAALTAGASATAQAATNAGSAPPVSSPAIADARAAGVTAFLPDVPAEQPASDGELVSLRTATSRTYLGPRGTRSVRLYSAPVNVRTGDGSWVPVDTTVVAAPGGGWSTRRTAVVPSFPASLAAGPVGVTAAGATVGMQLTGATSTAGVASGSRVTYPDALGGVDVSYDALANGVKETLVLHSAAAPSRVSFGLSLPAGASLAGQPDGGLAVRVAGATVFTLPAPSAVDSAGGPGRAAATRASYAVSGPAGSPTVTVTVPGAWLSDPARVFPVLVDPTSVGSTAAYDTYIEGASQANANFDSAPGGQVCAGYDAATGAPARALVRFVDDALPTNVRVVAAAVHEHVLSTTGSQTLTVYPVTTAWDEFQATWNSHHTGQSWSSPGGDLGAAEDSQTLSGADPDNTWHTWTVNPAEVQTWLSDPSANKGYALRAPVETSGNLVCLQGQPATGNAPYLQVIYEPVVGLPSSATALTHALDDSAALHVNVSNGNLVFTPTTPPTPTSPGSPVRWSTARPSAPPTRSPAAT